MCCRGSSVYFHFEISIFVNLADGLRANPTVHADTSLWLILQAWRSAQRPFCLANKIHMASVFGLRTAWAPPLHASCIRNENRVAPLLFSSSPLVLSRASLSCFQLKHKRVETVAGKTTRAKLFSFSQRNWDVNHVGGMKANKAEQLHYRCRLQGWRNDQT